METLRCPALPALKPARKRILAAQQISNLIALLMSPPTNLLFGSPFASILSPSLAPVLSCFYSSQPSLPSPKMLYLFSSPSLSTRLTDCRSLDILWRCPDLLTGFYNDSYLLSTNE